MLIVYCDRNLLWEFRGCLITFLTSEYMSFMILTHIIVCVCVCVCYFM